MPKARKPDPNRADAAPAVAPGQFDALIAVLDAVRGGTANTRPELIARTGLSRAVVTQRVADLVSRGLLEEGHLGPSTGGRAPRILRFRAQDGHVLTADLGATSVAVGLADLSGQLLDRHEAAGGIAAGPDELLGLVHELFEEMIARHADLPGRLWGIGIGVPGPVEFSSGRLAAPPVMPGWDRFPVRDVFAERYDVPVWVDNDVNVMALGEVRAGIARDHEVVVFVKLGTGLGAGIVVGGRVLRGAIGCAGDIGHIQVTDDPSVVCRCGKIGCLEALAGGSSIGLRAERLALDGRSTALARILEANGRIEAVDVAQAAVQGDAASVDLIDDVGVRVGAMLATVVNLVNPSLIVVGGGVSKAGDSLLASIRKTIYARSPALATRDLLIQRTQIEATGGLIGAASMVVDELFAPRTLAAWLEHRNPAGHPDLVRSGA
jgi:glucokinase-like ROK family protein